MLTDALFPSLTSTSFTRTSFLVAPKDWLLLLSRIVVTSHWHRRFICQWVVLQLDQPALEKQVTPILSSDTVASDFLKHGHRRFIDDYSRSSSKFLQAALFFKCFVSKTSSRMQSCVIFRACYFSPGEDAFISRFY